jgi:hypothetical protein
MRKHRSRDILVDVLAGGLFGGLVGAVVAINFVLIIGVDQGYEASLGEVFSHSVIAGIVTLGILLAGPIVGFLVARRRRAINESTRGSDLNESRLAR